MHKEAEDLSELNAQKAAETLLKRLAVTQGHELGINECIIVRGRIYEVKAAQHEKNRYVLQERENPIQKWGNA